MKNFALLIVSFWVTVSAHAACDSYLQDAQKDPRKDLLFKKDCAIQDRFGAVRDYFTSIGINVNELAEYRMIRFIDRYNVDKAKTNETAPSLVYDPAPVTWQVWDSGMRSIFGNDHLPFVLFTTDGFNSRGRGFDHLNIANFNTILLKNSYGDVSRDHLNNRQSIDSTPGTYRSSVETIAGWTAHNKDVAGQVQQAQASMEAAQKNWESLVGASFSTIVAKNKGLNPNKATLSVPMTVSPQADGTYYVAFAPGNLVASQMSWLNTFVNENISRYRKGNPVMPPIELSALVQKWLVTIHPFADGNGRTSRAVQDVILANFKMPYAPAGDLQNDVLASYDTYIDETYAAMEKMVKSLEVCAEEYRQKKEKPSYACRTVHSIEQEN